MLRTISTTLLGLLLVSGCYAGADESAAAILQPRSLAGTDLDGALRSEHGVFVFDEAARRTFDQLLTADGELTPAELDAWARNQLATRLPADALDDAVAAWHAYTEFRADAAVVLADAGADRAASERRLTAMVHDQLGAYPIAALELADITRAFALERAAALTGEARDAALAAVDGPVPEDSEAATFLVGRRAVELARLAGAGAGELQAVRAEQFGSAAADRLAALDARRAAWDGRIAAFRGERDALLAGFTGTPTQRDAALAGLTARHFSDAEARRVHALDRIAAD